MIIETVSSNYERGRAARHTNDRAFERTDDMRQEMTQERFAVATEKGPPTKRTTRQQDKQEIYLELLGQQGAKVGLGDVGEHGMVNINDLYAAITNKMSQ